MCTGRRGHPGKDSKRQTAKGQRTGGVGAKRCWACSSKVLLLCSVSVCCVLRGALAPYVSHCTSRKPTSGAGIYQDGATVNPRKVINLCGIACLCLNSFQP
jgi:hypothetical protein